MDFNCLAVVAEVQIYIGDVVECGRQSSLITDSPEVVERLLIKAQSALIVAQIRIHPCDVIQVDSDVPPVVQGAIDVQSARVCIERFLILSQSGVRRTNVIASYRFTSTISEF